MKPNYTPQNEKVKVLKGQKARVIKKHYNYQGWRIDGITFDILHRLGKMDVNRYLKKIVLGNNQQSPPIIKER